MRRAVVVAAAAVGLTVTTLAGCSAVSDSGRPHVVVTTNILGDVVEEVLGDQADVTVLMPPDSDPHSSEISAKQAAMMGDADLIVSNGLGLEEGLQQHLDRAEDAGAPMLVAGDEVDVVPYASGDAEGDPDPHFWTDPATMVDVVDALEKRAADIDGLDVVRMRRDAAEYRDELTTLDAEMTTTFAAIAPQRRALVTNHHVFGYLADRFGFEVVGAVIPGGTTLAAPSAADLRDLNEAISTAGVSTIFAESSQPDRLVKVLADEARIDVDVVELFTESLTKKGGGAETYLDMMRANTSRIAAGLTP